MRAAMLPENNRGWLSLEVPNSDDNIEAHSIPESRRWRHLQDLETRFVTRRGRPPMPQLLRLKTFVAPWIVLLQKEFCVQLTEMQTQSGTWWRQDIVLKARYPPSTARAARKSCNSPGRGASNGSSLPLFGLLNSLAPPA